MSKAFSIVILCLVAGCASTTPQQAATSTLLAGQKQIVAIRQGIAVPCQKGLIQPADCRKIDQWYQQSKPLFDLADDAVQVWILSGSTAEPASTQAAIVAFTSVVSDAATLAVKYGVKGVPDGK